MNKYQEAMFKSYWFPAMVFYVFPNVILMLVAWPISFIEIIRYFLPFLAALFISGYILSPILGPKVKENKGWSFLMAFVCMFIALITCIGLAGGLNTEYLSFNLLLLLMAAVFGIFPAILGGLFYVGACDAISKNT